MFEKRGQGSGDDLTVDRIGDRQALRRRHHQAEVEDEADVVIQEVRA